MMLYGMRMVHAPWNITHQVITHQHSTCMVNAWHNLQVSVDRR